jgi:hypothetical protein
MVSSEGLAKQEVQRKIFLVKRSFSKEKASGKGLVFIVERNDKTEELEYYCKVNMRLLSFLRACKLFDENIRDALLQGVNEQVLKENKDNSLTLTEGKASLMHVSEEEKCVEIDQELEEKIINELDKEGMVKRLILLKLVPEVFQKLKEELK